MSCVGRILPLPRALSSVMKKSAMRLVFDMPRQREELRGGTTTVFCALRAFVLMITMGAFCHAQETKTLETSEGSALGRPDLEALPLAERLSAVGEAAFTNIVVFQAVLRDEYRDDVVSFVSRDRGELTSAFADYLYLRWRNRMAVLGPQATRRPRATTLCDFFFGGVTNMPSRKEEMIRVATEKLTDGPIDAFGPGAPSPPNSSDVRISTKVVNETPTRVDLRVTKVFYGTWGDKYSISFSAVELDDVTVWLPSECDWRGTSIY